jgi:hypothetical protein
MRSPRERRAVRPHRDDEELSAPPSPHDLLRLQRTIGNQAVGRLVQRLVVQSDWLKMVPPDAAPMEGTSAEKAPTDKSAKKAELGEPTIFISKSYGGPYVECTDTTDTGYRDNAEKALGPLDALDVLANWKVLKPSAQSGASAFAKAHLIAAEFGGQYKYPPAENIRFHQRELEYGEWQKAENKVKRSGKLGYVTARSNEAKAARDTAELVVNVIRDKLDAPVAVQLEQRLALLLKAADFVPFDVGFRYTDDEDPGKSFEKEWGDQDAHLRLDAGVTPAAVYGALNKLGLLAPLGISMPAESASPAKRTITSRADLIALLSEFCGKSGSGRKKTIATSLNATLNIPAEKFGAAQFAEKLKKLPELTNEVFTIDVVGDFRTWIPKVDPLKETEF